MKYPNEISKFVHYPNSSEYTLDYVFLRSHTIMRYIEHKIVKSENDLLSLQCSINNVSKSARTLNYEYAHVLSFRITHS